MSKKRQRKSEAAHPPNNDETEDVTGASTNNTGARDAAGDSGNGAAPPVVEAGREMIALDRLLANISARLVTTGSVSLFQPQPPLGEAREYLQIIIFTLESIRYAVEIGHVSEVVRNSDVTPVPGLPDWILGVTNLHGDILSVVDLARFLELGTSTGGNTSSMIVAHAADQRVGLLVDSIELIYTFPVDKLVSPPFKIEPGIVTYLRGAVDREKEFIRVLDCEHLLLGPQMQRFS